MNQILINGNATPGFARTLGDGLVGRFLGIASLENIPRNAPERRRQIRAGVEHLEHLCRRQPACTACSDEHSMNARRVVRILAVYPDFSRGARAHCVPPALPRLDKFAGCSSRIRRVTPEIIVRPVRTCLRHIAGQPATDPGPQRRTRPASEQSACGKCPDADPLPAERPVDCGRKAMRALGG